MKLNISATKSHSANNEMLEAEIQAFTKSVKNLSPAELERDISELTNDIDFVEKQVELETYTRDDLAEANAKILLMRRKLEILKDEYSKAQKTKDSTTTV